MIDHPHNSTARITDELRRAIRTGRLLPGQRLVQQKLAAEFDVSRIPLREALHALAGEGLIDVSSQRGVVVTKLDRTAIAELFDLRLLLEPGLAEQIVRGCRPRDVDELADLAARMRELGGDADGRAVLNYRFHHAMYGLTERHLTIRFVDQLLHMVDPYSRQWVRSGTDLSRIDAEHDGMVEAMRAADTEALRELIHRHIHGARDHVLQANPTPRT